MKTDSCAYPPQLAADVEITAQRDGDRESFIVGAPSVGRYLLLRATEQRVLQLLGATPAAVCAEFQRQTGGALSLSTLTKFLTRLEASGILAGERSTGHPLPEQALSTQFYWRFSLFNPDALFTRMVSVLRWVWTTQFFVGSLMMMILTALLALLNGAEVASYAGYILREHYVAVVIAGLLVGVTHEFAHGLTCKAFGGRATEIGALLIYYVLPALYCNVSGLHLIPERSRRLWVIAAGVYWQLLVGTLALLAWLMLAPYTLPADLAFIFFCGSVLDVAFNANPLIKLDGYYFLSQWLGMPNLMERARTWWRECLRRIVGGEARASSARFTRREQMMLAAFGSLSFMYTVVLRCFIVSVVGAALIEWFHLPGLLLAAVLALFFLRRMLAAILAKLRNLLRTYANGNMKTDAQNPQVTASGQWRRRMIPLAIVLLVMVVLCLPWNASVGNYGTLFAIPGQEAIIRAPESATLIELRVRPGEMTTSGALIGRMGNPELEDQRAQAQAELERAQAESATLSGELRAHEEAIAGAEVKLRQRQHDYEESHTERRQIEAHLQEQVSMVSGAKYLTASVTPVARFSLDNHAATSYPAALAVLQSEAELRQTKAAEAGLRLARARRLYAQGIVPRSELDEAEARAATLTTECTAARQRLESALVEHRRHHTKLATELQLAQTDAGAERMQASKLAGELRPVQSLVSTLAQRQNLLQRRLLQFALVTPNTGTVFGEDLPRLLGQHFQKGAEICRVADTRQMLLRLQVPERELADVREGLPVRLKVRAFPDQVFYGRVAKIGSESEPDQNQQATYRVELMIENPDARLRPGMTAFARIDAGRQMIGRILLHKLRQALRPELWLL